MSMRNIARILVIASVVTLAGPVCARPFNPDRPVKTTIHLWDKATVAGKTLAPGRYRLIVVGNEATLKEGHTVVAEVPCKWRMMAHKAQNNALVFRKDQLKEVQFEGKTRALDLG